MAGLISRIFAFRNGAGAGKRALVDADDHAQVDVLSSALPAGAATSANQQTNALTNTELRATAVPVSGPLTDAQLRATPVPVSSASLPLPSGAATEATLATRVAEATFTGRFGEVQASPTANTLLARLKDLLTELQLKADSTETQPVSAASLPLPSGAATQTTLAALLTELALKADLTETQPVSAASLPLPSGAATSAKQDALFAELQLKADLTETQPVSGTVTLSSYAGTEADEQVSVATATAVPIPSSIPSVSYRLTFSADIASAARWLFRRTTGTSFGHTFYPGQTISIEMAANEAIFVAHNSGSSQNVNVTKEPIS